MPLPNVEFIVEPDKMIFTTQTNGDHVDMKVVHLDATNAANLAYLINSQINLKVEIKEA